MFDNDFGGLFDLDGDGSMSADEMAFEYMVYRDVVGEADDCEFDLDLDLDKDDW